MFEFLHSTSHPVHCTAALGSSEASPPGGGMAGAPTFYDVLATFPEAQGPEKRINIRECFPETGFGVLPAVPSRRATSHD